MAKKTTMELFITQEQFNGLTERERLIYDVLNQGHHMTDREVKRKLKCEDMNDVRPAITRMVQNGILNHPKNVACKETLRSVRVTIAVPLAPTTKRKTKKGAEEGTTDGEG